MTRDLVADDATHVYTLQRVDIVGLPPSLSNRVHRSRSSYRTDIIKTAPRKDGFRVPTNYRSFFGTCIAYPFATGVYPSGGSNQHWVSSGTTASAAAGESAIGWVGCVNAIPLTVPFISYNLRARCQTEALLMLKNGDLDLGIALAEARRTFTMISDSVKNLIAAFKAAKRGDFRRMGFILGLYVKAKHRKLKWENVWLLYRFGWMPLVNDIWGAIQTIRKGWVDASPLMSVTKVVTETPTWPSLPGGGYFKGYVMRGIETKIFYKVSSAWMYTLDQLGLVNPGTIAWELMPFSFVVDWMIPVGNFLQALTAPIGIEFSAGYQTSFAKGKYDAFWTSQFNFRSGIREHVRVDYKCMQRVTLGALPPALPYVKFGLNATRTITAIALLKQGAR